MVCTDMEGMDTDPGRMLEGLRCAVMVMRREVMHLLPGRTDMDMPAGDIRAEVSRRVAEWLPEAEEDCNRFGRESGAPEAESRLTAR